VRGYLAIVDMVARWNPWQSMCGDRSEAKRENLIEDINIRGGY
jgi:hypothetical protein